MSYRTRRDLDLSDSEPLPLPNPAQDPELQNLMRRAELGWETHPLKTRNRPIWKLLIAEAYLANLSLRPRGSDSAEEQISWLRERVARILRDEARAEDVLAEPATLGLVRALFGEPGVTRLYDRVKDAAREAA